MIKASGTKGSLITAKNSIKLMMKKASSPWRVGDFLAFS
jgi:hypothetical protein